MFLITQMEQIVQQISNKSIQIPMPITLTETAELRVAEKLAYHNYTTWCKLISIAVESRERLNHITATPLSPTESSNIQWKQRDSLIFSWLISNISSDLVNRFLDYTTF